MGKGIQKIKISVVDPSLTHYGGMLLFQQFCRKLNLKILLQRNIRWQRRKNIYHPAELILTILYTMVAGMRRVSATRILNYNGYFQRLLGFKNFPGASTLREFLVGLTTSEVEGIIRVHDLLSSHLNPWLGIQSSLWLDLDSTVLSVFGWQIEGAKVGYHPRHPGRPSYHPLLCFEGHTRSIWHGVFREGNTSALSGIENFWQECTEKFPAYLYRIRLRTDSGFYSRKFVDILDEQKADYIIVAKMTSPMQAKVQTLTYKNFNPLWQAGEFMYQPQGWQTPHRFVVIRRPRRSNDPEDSQIQLWEHKNYFYHVLVTNLPLQPPFVWYFYKKRARCELDIRELKESFPLGKIPSRNFLANQAHFHLILLAYDLVNWFKHLSLPPLWHTATLQTIRTDLLVVPARLVHSGRQRNSLKLPLGYIHYKNFCQAIKNIERLKIW